MRLAKDPVMKAIVDALWRNELRLYKEKYPDDPALRLINVIAEEVETGQALGMDHQVKGDQSTAIGIGGVTRAFRELMVGSYGLDKEAISADEWNVLDLLFVLGNGVDKDNRSNAIEVFKSGLIKIFNALQLGEFSHGDSDPLEGTLEYGAEGLRLWENGQWNKVGARTLTEQMGGLVNGVNREFTTSRPYVSGSIQVYVNGMKQAQGDFHELNDTTIVFDDMNSPPTNREYTDYVECTYLPK